MQCKTLTVALPADTYQTVCGVSKKFGISKADTLRLAFNQQFGDIELQKAEVEDSKPEPKKEAEADPKDDEDVPTVHVVKRFPVRGIDFFQ